jgi:MFS family permease
MATVTIHRPTVGNALDPRDDGLVAERRISADDAGHAGEAAVTFEGTGGPFIHWRRTVEIEPDDAGTGAVIERISYRTALGIWSPLFAIPIRRAVITAFESDDPPWWSPPDRLDAGAARALSTACTLAVIGGFLAGQLTQTLTYMGDEFHAGVHTQTIVLEVVRVGAVATFAGAWLADRIGRRPVILWSYVIAAVTGVATAIAPSLATATILQTCCRSAVVVGVVLLPVAAAEDLPAGTRAFAMGLLAMCGGLGVGIVILMLPLAGVARPWSWRLIYVVGVLAIPATWAAGRHMPETSRYTALAEADTRHEVRAKVQGFRLAIMGAALLFLNAFLTPASQLQNQFLRVGRGFSPSRITIFIIGTNAFGGLGVVLGGRLADKRGRHVVATIGLIGLAVGSAGMYASRGWPMWAWSTVGSGVGAFCIPALGVLNPELFPTARRGTASGALNAIAVVGAVGGLLLAGAMIDGIGYGSTFIALAAAPILVIGLLRFVPETARVSLEDLNPGDVGGDGPDNGESGAES